MFMASLMLPTRGRSGSGLDLAAGLAKRGFRYGIADAGDNGNDSERAVAQFSLLSDLD